MLAGVLTALKIIGLILLGILAFLILVLLLVMFVPIRYQVDAIVPETELDQGFDKDKIYFRARATWLLHFISGGVEFPDNPEFTVKVLGIKVFPQKDKGKDTEEDSDKDNKDENKENNESVETEAESSDNVTDTDNSAQTAEVDAESEEISSGSEDEKTSDSDSDSDIVNISEEDSDNSVNGADNSDNSDEEEEDKALIEILTDIFEKIGNILKTPQNVFENIQYTISRVYDKIEMIKSTLENDIFKRAFNLVKGKLIKILKMIMPKKVDIRLLLGTGDPADTAEILALFSALYPILYNKVDFKPDFERKVVAAEAHLKGRLTVFTMAYCVCICYFNRDVKKVLKRFKKIMEK